MTKADIVNEIAKNTGIDKVAVLTTVEAFMDAVKDSLAKEIPHKQLIHYHIDRLKYLFHAKVALF